MKATEANLLGFLRKSPQFMIPDLSAHLLMDQDALPAALG